MDEENQCLVYQGPSIGEINYSPPYIFKHGYTFSLLRFVQKVLHNFDLCANLLHLNRLASPTTLKNYMKQYGEEPSLKVFKHYYQLGTCLIRLEKWHGLALFLFKQNSLIKVVIEQKKIHAIEWRSELLILPLKGNSYSQPLRDLRIFWILEDLVRPQNNKPTWTSINKSLCRKLQAFIFQYKINPFGLVVYFK